MAELLGSAVTGLRVEVNGRNSDGGGGIELVCHWPLGFWVIEDAERNVVMAEERSVLWRCWTLGLQAAAV
ncbi:hypothetical protein M0R45_032889 [Rubus argutus]|uniref:Uncharacterized protein n=1 Tax=Rubus argutus TaxID=59490 RepID=A0AAW1WLP8_RUBAR